MVRTAPGRGRWRHPLMKDRSVTRSPTRSPTGLPARTWWQVLIGAIREFDRDNLSDTAAALTYYAVLSIFPALLLIVAIIGLFGQQPTTSLVDHLGQLVPNSAHDVIKSAIGEISAGGRTAGWTAVAGLLGAYWSASGYVGAFIRAANTVFDVPEGRPYWKVLPIRLGLTLVLLIVMAATSVAVVATGGIARRLGALLGVTDTAVVVWNVAKWPVLAALVTMTLALLFWASPNARQSGFRWITPGCALAVLLWIIASAGFAFYVANFGSYNRVYGAVAGVIVFLVWIWVSNLAILFGAEFDAELQRAKAHADGLPPGTEPYLPLRSGAAGADDGGPRSV